jgi:hypothetical protein
MISILLALLAALGGHPVTPSDVSGGPVSAPSARTAAPGRLSGGLHTSDVSGTPITVHSRAVGPAPASGGRHTSDVSGTPIT